MTHWPTLDFASEQRVYETAHLYLQLIGKLPTRLHPWINHGWHVALRVTPHGFMTSTIPVGARSDWPEGLTTQSARLGQPPPRV